MCYLTNDKWSEGVLRRSVQLYVKHCIWAVFSVHSPASAYDTRWHLFQVTLLHCILAASCLYNFISENIFTLLYYNFPLLHWLTWKLIIYRYLEVITPSFSYRPVYQAGASISTKSLIYGLMWKQPCYNLFIIRSNSLFVMISHKHVIHDNKIFLG